MMMTGGGAAWETEAVGRQTTEKTLKDTGGCRLTSTPLACTRNKQWEEKRQTKSDEQIDISTHTHRHPSRSTRYPPPVSTFLILGIFFLY